MKSLLLLASCSVLLILHGPAAEPPAAKATPKPKPERQAGLTLADVHYGPGDRQVLDFYQAPSSTPTPLVFFVHGGGWGSGYKEGVSVRIDKMFQQGISVVSVEYRFVKEAAAAGHRPPVEWPLRDAARALQFVRSKAKEWNIDPERIGASGGSAGACTSLWLAFHPEMAEPESTDPIARFSTRLKCVAVGMAQTTLDPQQMREWTPNSTYGGHAFGLGGFENFLRKREQILPWIAEYSPYALLTSDDPPVYLIYGAPPALGQEQKDPTHTANFGVKLQEKAKSVGVSCELVYPGAPEVQHRTIDDYLVEMLKK